jgi:ankyrin repeat protein
VGFLVLNQFSIDQITFALALIRAGADVKNHQRKGCLHLAMSNCKTSTTSSLGHDTTQLLLLWHQLVAFGPDIDSIDISNDTPLHLAVQNGNSLGASFLLNRNANPNLPNKLGFTPLHLAVLSSNLLLVLILLRNGSDPKIRSSKVGNELSIFYLLSSIFYLLSSALHFPSFIFHSFSLLV